MNTLILNILKKTHLSFHSLSLPFTPFHSLKKHSPLLSLLLASFLFASCGTRVVLDEERTFSSTWHRFTPQEFEVDIPDADLYFHVDYTVTVDTSIYRYDRLPLVVDIHSADGTHRHLTPVVMLKENGRWKGQQDGPNRVVSARVHNYFTFNQKGVYSYQVKQGTSQYDLEGVRAFHVRIEEAQLDYDLD